MWFFTVFMSGILAEKGCVHVDDKVCKVFMSGTGRVCSCRGHS